MPDIEMARRNGERKDEVPEFTEYRPLNWKKIFLTPKYIRVWDLGGGVLG